MANQWNPAPGSRPPPTPPARSGLAKGCLLGCGLVVTLLAGLCGVGLFLAYQLANAVIEPIRAQAAAFARGDDAAVCRHNSPTLSAQMPCAAYVAWLRQNTPYFAGAELTPKGFNALNYNATEPRAALMVQAAGPRGNGRMTFYMVQHGGAWQVERVEPF